MNFSTLSTLWKQAAGLSVALLMLATSHAGENPSFAAENGIYVNPMSREYNEDHFDLAVHALGMDFQIYRSYSQKDGWEFRRLIPRLEFTRDPGDPSLITHITREYQEFEASGGNWEYNFMLIEVDPAGYKFTDTQTGYWEIYNIDGLIQSFGRGAETLGIVTNNAAGYIETIERPDSTVLVTFTYDQPGRLTHAINNAGAYVEYTWNGANLTEYRDIRGNITRYTYSNGRITQRETTYDKGNGETVTITRNMTYDPTYGDIKSITDESGWGRFFEYSYDNTFNEYYIKETHSVGRIEERFYNADRELVRVKTNGTVVHEVDYLDEGNRIFVTDGLGNVTEELITVDGTTQQTFLPDGTEIKSILKFDDRDGNYRVIRQVDGRGIETKYDYDAQGRITQMIEAAGTPSERRMVYTFDSVGNLKTQKIVGDANMPDATTVFFYDDYGRQTGIQDAEGNLTEVVYDDFNRTIERIDAKLNSTLYTYDDATGDLLTETTPLGFTTTYTYDYLGRLASLTNEVKDTILYRHNKFSHEMEMPDGSILTVNYNRDGQVTEIVDPAGIRTLREYDEIGRYKKVIDGNGNATERFYNPNMTGHSQGGFDVLEKVVYPTFEQRLEFDSLYRTTKEIVDLGNGEVRTTEALGFDGNGNPLAYRDTLGNPINYAYDALNRMTTRTVELNGQQKISQIVFNDFDLPVTITMPDSGVYSFTYDRMGNVLTRTSPDTTVYTYAYDELNRMVEAIMPDGRKSVFTYDDDGRPATREYYRDQNDLTPELVYTITYDDANRLVGLTDGTTTVTYVRDAVGRILTESIDAGGGFTMSYSLTYYPNGQVQTYTAPDGMVYTYTYDDAGLLKTISAPDMGVISWADYEWRKPVTITYPGGLTRTMTYDALQDIASVAMRDANDNVLFNESYLRNAQAKVTEVTTQAGIVEYDYDEELQLTEVDSTDPGIPDEAFSYDLNLNRTGDLAGNSYTYNDLNAVLSQGADLYTYDANGNLTSRFKGSDFYEFFYTADQRISRVDLNGSFLASYNYDPFGRRVAKQTATGTTYYMYSDEGLIAEFDASGNVIRSYGYEQVGYIEEQGNTKGLRALFQKEGGNYHFVVNDHNFRQRMLVKSDGAIVWQADVTAFGKALVDPASTVTCNLRFSKQYYDAETGLHYNTMRYYDPELGRYMRPDPMGIEPADNVYSFANNCPTYFVDIKGLACSGCHGIAYAFGGEKKLWKGFGIEVKAKYKVNAKGQVCKVCCDDGTCGWKGSLTASFTGELEGSYKTTKIDIWIASVGIGLKVAVAGGFEVGGSATVSCEGERCGKFSGKVYGKITVGGYAEFEILGHGGEAFAGGAATICGKVTCSVCPNSAPSCKIMKVGFGGEIYVSAKLKFGSRFREWKITILKGGDC